MELKFTCKECKLTGLSVNDFSKSQINKLDHGKICDNELKCCKCVENTQSLELQLKLLRKLQSTNEAILSTKSIRNSKIIESCISIQEDPSLTYIRNPLVTPITHEFLSFFRSIGFEALLHIGPSVGWRTVAKLAVRSNNDVKKSIGGTKKKLDKSTINIGLFRPGTHEVLDCNDSPVHHPSINHMLRIIRSACNRCKTPAFHEEAQVGLLRYILFGVELCSSKVQITLVWNTVSNLNSDEKSEEMLSSLAMTIQQLDVHKILHSLWVHYHPAIRHVNAITGRDEGSWRMLVGRSPIIERIDVGLTPLVGYDKSSLPGLRFPPNVFRQANLVGFSKIIKEIRRWIPSGSSCMELYGGVGTIGLNCIDLVSSLKCSDENPYNKICFEETVSELPDSWRCKAQYCSLSAAAMVQSDNLLQYDLILVDPPRKGLEEEVVAALVASPSPPSFSARKKCNDSTEGAHSIESRSTIRLIYVSCGFKAFQRDMKSLTEIPTQTQTQFPTDSLQATATTRKKRKISASQSHDGCWRLIHVEGHVLFPGSDHVETLAIFERNRPSP